jgi:3-dehydroquinate dehydratase type I
MFRYVTNMTHLAVATAATDTDSALTQANAIKHAATLVEYRLDLMGDFDLEQLLAESPLPAIITCRHPAQGGHFDGSERERQNVLHRAIALGAPFVDVEWETLHAFNKTSHSGTRIIGSFHDFQGMLGDWASTGLRIRRAGADIVKLVGTAQNGDDVLTPMVWLKGLSAPGVGITMGANGVASRILAPRFSQAFLSFAAIGVSTAPGQIRVVELCKKFGYHLLAAADPLLVILTPDPIPWDVIESYRAGLTFYANSTLIRPHILPIPTRVFGPGLLLSLLLARTHGILCLPGVERISSLSHYGINPSANAWRLDRQSFQGLTSSDIDPVILMRFWLSPEVLH